MTKRMIRHLTLLVAAVLAVMPALWAAPQASATTACYSSPNNTDCNGVSPHQTVSGSSCWDDAYLVPLNNPAVADYTDPKTGWEYVTALAYSPHCHTNWAEVTAWSHYNSTAFASAQVSAKVRRYDGSDGGYLMEHMSGWVTLSLSQYEVLIISPMVYSPDNPAQACVSLPNDDQASCTIEL